jgi:transcriptional regulator with XRE-family HTH domain
MTVAKKKKTHPGASLKKLRIRKGLTLLELSERTGLPSSSVSRMENGKTALTFDKLLKFSEALGVDVMEVIGDTGGASPSPSMSLEAPRDGAMRRSIGRAGEGEVVETPRGNYLYLVAELLHKQFVPIVGDVLAKDISTYGEYAQHPGEEFVYVLSGTLELHTEMYTPAVLEEGDYVYFDSGMRHAYIARGDKPCRVLSICSTPEPHLATSEAAQEHEAPVADNKLPAKPQPRPRAGRKPSLTT